MITSGQKGKLTTAEALATRSLNLPRPSAVPERRHYSRAGRKRKNKTDASGRDGSLGNRLPFGT